MFVADLPLVAAGLSAGEPFGNSFPGRADLPSVAQAHGEVLEGNRRAEHVLGLTVEAGALLQVVQRSSHVSRVHREQAGRDEVEAQTVGGEVGGAAVAPR